MEPTPPTRRRRRAARRPAGPPTNGSPADDPVDDGDAPSTAAPHTAVESTAPADPGGLPGIAASGPAVPDPTPDPTPTPHGGPTPAPTGSPGQHPPRPPVDRRPSAAEGGRRTRASGQDNSERSLRSLVTTRSTQVSSTAAMRAREVALPNEADLAVADAELVIVRRHYVPPTSLPAAGRPDRRGGQGRPRSG